MRPKLLPRAPKTSRLVACHYLGVTDDVATNVRPGLYYSRGRVHDIYPTLKLHALGWEFAGLHVGCFLTKLLQGVYLTFPVFLLAVILGLVQPVLDLSPNGEHAPPPATALPGIPSMPGDFVAPAADEHLRPDAARGAGELG